MNELYEAEVEPHARDVNEPHVPERICTRTCEGADEIVTVCVFDCATNLYHTSYLSEAPQPTTGRDVGSHVALTFVPAVFTHVVEEVSVAALAQLSFAGCAKELNEKNIPSSSNAKVA